MSVWYLGLEAMTKVSALCLLDLTAAFNIVDHKLLLQRLQRNFGISGSAPMWFKSYLPDRTHCVVVDSVMSQVIRVLSSVPLGSILGPLLFLLYTADLPELAVRFGVTLHAYADDDQLYLSCRTDDANLFVVALERCVTAISHWMSTICFKLNTNKMEWLWTGTGSNLDWLPKSARRLTLGNNMIDIADAVWVLSSCRIWVWSSTLLPSAIAVGWHTKSGDWQAAVRNELYGASHHKHIEVWPRSVAHRSHVLLLPGVKKVPYMKLSFPETVILRNFRSPERKWGGTFAPHSELTL